MRRFSITVTVCFILGLFIAVVAPTTVLWSAAPMKTIVIATDATWPPMEILDANKNIVGFDIDLLNAVAKEAGFKVELKNTAWDDIFGGLDLGKYNAIISSVTITDSAKRNTTSLCLTSMQVRCL